MNLSTRADLEKRGITFSNKHLIALESRGLFPRRVRLGLRSVAWVKEEIDAYLAGLAEARGDLPKAA